MLCAHILFVEDETPIRMMVAEALIDAGLHLTLAAGGEAALVLLDGARFDLLLTDVHMPGPVNGIDLARQVRTRWPGTPVVFVTGRPDVLGDFGPLGPQECCVLKPYRPSDVLAAITNCLAGRPRFGETLSGETLHATR